MLPSLANLNTNAYSEEEETIRSLKRQVDAYRKKADELSQKLTEANEKVFYAQDWVNVLSKIVNEQRASPGLLATIRNVFGVDKNTTLDDEIVKIARECDKKAKAIEHLIERISYMEVYSEYKSEEIKKLKDQLERYPPERFEKLDSELDAMLENANAIMNEFEKLKSKLDEQNLEPKEALIRRLASLRKSMQEIDVDDEDEEDEKQHYIRSDLIDRSDSEESSA